MMTLSIRSLTSADEPLLWNMLYHALYVPAGQRPFLRDILRAPEIARYAEGWGRRGDVGVMAELKDEAVGAAWLRLWSTDDQGYGFVDSETPELSIAVLPAYRNQGIGSQLLARLLETSRPSMTGVSLSVHRDNPALALYQRFGFQAIREYGDSLTMLLRWR